MLTQTERQMLRLLLDQYQADEMAATEIAANQDEREKHYQRADAATLIRESLG